MISRLFIIIVSILLLGSVSGVESVCSAETGVCEAPSRQCSLYMAESTIPHAGLGIFTGVPRHAGDDIGTGDVLIPVIDLWYHLDAGITEDYRDPTSDYIWHGPEMGMQQETSHPNEHVSAFAPGLDAAINCHLGLINVDKNVPAYDVSGLHRSRDPGAGAITPYHNCTTAALRKIPVGGELFKDYGNKWFETRPYAFEKLPLREDYPKAEALARRFYSKMMALKLPSSAAVELWDIITDPALGSRTLNALPSDYADMEVVVKKGIRSYYQPSGVKTLEDLDATGRCLDIFRPGKSTIPQAGRGLFATQLLAVDSIVAGTPLLQVQDPRVFDMFQGDWFDKDEEPDREQLAGHQIMMNYCWKHWESSIFLCPYGAGVNYINHHAEPNVRLQWAEDGVMGHKANWLTKTPNNIGFKASPGLFLDLIATKEIQPGEEIFMDYGEEWQTAWDEHVVEFEMMEYPHSASYQSARDWNKANGEALLWTGDEQVKEPYPSHMELRCLTDIDDATTLKNIEAARQWNIGESGIPCDIIERRKPTEDDVDADENEYYYKVKYAPKVWNPEIEYFDPGEDWFISEWIPRGALSFVDRPYSTDLFLDGVFRYPIGFPDGIFPDSWKNEREEAAEARDDE